MNKIPDLGPALFRMAPKNNQQYSPLQYMMKCLLYCQQCFMKIRPTDRELSVLKKIVTSSAVPTSIFQLKHGLLFVRSIIDVTIGNTVALISLYRL